MARKRDKVLSMLFPKKYNKDHVGSQTNGLQPKHPAKRLLMKAKRLLINSTYNILRSQSQSLITLSLAYNFTGHETIVPGTFPDLPRLKELTIAMAWSFRPPQHQVLAIMQNLPRFPALLRFDMLGVIVPMADAHLIISRLLSHSPSVTHVGLPIVYADNTPYAALALDLAMDLLPVKDQYPLHVFLQANPWDYNRLFRAARLESFFFLSVLDIIIDTTNDERLHFMQREDTIQECPEMQGKNWEDRILGGIGGWFESAGPHDWQGHGCDHRHIQNSSAY